MLLFLAFFLAGPGKWSMDHFLFGGKHTKVLLSRNE
jgi:hypothetical protein